MTEEQIAEELHRINGLLMSLVADAAQLGLAPLERLLNDAQKSVVSAGRLVEPLVPGLTPDPLGFADGVKRDVGRLRGKLR